MAKEKWANAAEIESRNKTPLRPQDIHAESYTLPVLAVDIGEVESGDSSKAEMDGLVESFLESNPDLTDKIQTENLDVVAHKVKSSGGKSKWVLIIGFGFAALAIGMAGYQLIHKHSKPKEENSRR